MTARNNFKLPGNRLILKKQLDIVDIFSNAGSSFLVCRQKDVAKGGVIEHGLHIGFSNLGYLRQKGGPDNERAPRTINLTIAQKPVELLAVNKAEISLAKLKGVPIGLAQHMPAHNIYDFHGIVPVSKLSMLQQMLRCFVF